MTHAELIKAVERGKVPPLLCLHGEESFYRERTLKRVVRALVPEGLSDFNYTVYHGKDLKAAAFIETARTLPVFADRRLVVVKEGHSIPAPELDLLLEYVQDPAEETVFLLSADKIDGRKKFFQAFKKKGVLVEFKPLYENQIPAFIREQAEVRGLCFTPDALSLFCRRTGTSLQEIDAELTKLLSYMGGGDLIDVEQVRAVVSDTKQESVFELNDALGCGKADVALRLVQRLTQEGVAPLMILSLMSRHFRQLWKIRELIDRKTSSKEIPRLAGVNPYFLKGLEQQCRRRDGRQYRLLFEKMVETDLALKTGGGSPAALLEELVLFALSLGSGARA